jgi:hypothetical protein
MEQLYTFYFILLNMSMKSFLLPTPSFFKSSRDEKVRTTEAGPEPNMVQGLPLSGLIQGAQRASGLGKPFGKASLANTALRLGRFISMRDRSSWIG